MTSINKNILKHSVTDALFLSLLLLASPSAYAAPAPNTLPTGANVVAGNATITKSGTTENITASNGSIINWSGFDIGSHATVNFIQPSTSSVTLSRVTGSNSASQIFGALNANGTLFLVNTNGIMFGKGSQVNVGGLVATTSDINNDDFKNGLYKFSPTANGHSANSINTKAQIINSGTINITKDNGLVALIGHDVENDGIIQAKVNMGLTGDKVQLGAGDTFSIDLTGDGLINLAVTDPKAKQLLAQNSGTIKANDGTVLMTAAAAENTLSSVINMSGIIQADSVSTKNGSVQLVASGSNSQANVSGSVSSKGGSVKVASAQTNIQNGASITAAGGTVETSGTASLQVDNNVTVTANTWTIDPSNVLIADFSLFTPFISTSTVSNALSSGTNVAVTASNGAVTVLGNVTETGGLGAQLTLNASSDINIDASIKMDKGTFLANSTNGNITFGNFFFNSGSVSSTATGTAITLAASNGHLINNVGSSALSTPNGRWLAYTSSPTGDVINGLNYSFEQFNAPYATAAAQTTGNGFLYNTGLALDISLTGEVDKVYDGYTTATLASSNYDLTSGYTGTVSNTDASYDTKDVGSNKTVTANGLTLSSVETTGGLNVYGFTTNTTASAAIGNITPATLTISAVSQTKVYDGTVNSSQTPTETGLVGTDSFYASQSFASKDVLGTNGSSIIINNNYGVNDGNGGKDYTITLQNTTGTITPASLTISAVTDTKVYDGTTHSSQTPTETGLVGTDSFYASQSFASKDVLGTNGSSIIINNNYGVNDGNGGKDYTITLQNTTGTITPASLTISAVTDTKVYDGTTHSSQTPTETGLVGTDSFYASQSFASKDVLGTNGSSIIINNNYGVNDGNGGKDYTITLQNTTGTITPASLTITADNKNMTYGGTLPSLTASYSGFVAGENSSDLTTKPTVVSGTPANSNAGTYTGTLTASGAVDPNYTINYVAGNLTINPALLAIVANSNTMTYGSIVPNLTTTYIGFVNGDNSASLTTKPTETTTATSTSNVGLYSIKDSGAVDPNYNIVYVPGAMVVTPATLTYVANTASTIYGTAATGLTGTVTGFVNGQDLADATMGTLDFTTNAKANSNVGTYAIEGSGLIADHGNYVFVEANSNKTALTVNPATLTYVANDVSKVYGDAIPSLTGTVTGFVLGQTQANATTGSLSFSTTATDASNVGSYAVDGSGLTANHGNYVFVEAANNATALTVTPATLTVNANAQTKVYGSIDPTLTYGVTGFKLSDTAGTVLTGDLTRDPGEHVAGGPYAITQGSLATNPNYTISYTGNVLTITPYTLTVAANNQSMMYGGALPALTYTFGTLQNGDTNSVFSGGLTTAAADSIIGKYLIEQGSLTAGSDYTIAYTPGTLTIGAPLELDSILEKVKPALLAKPGQTGVLLALATSPTSGLAGLAPAAGGNDGFEHFSPAQLANLNPSAGGNAGGGVVSLIECSAAAPCEITQ